ncbi:TetR family transcriptional regulator C-terminal domain-containing protein [Winogradskyella alexanderae]|uniref:TetR/AcrR family transcriptional regulator n=1 Tax=Winogradskyella alexanderae TaxID=2877123 RepID=A0ABS7XVT9_9FLAO|nr:TetR family transcriptional regulator C-terminal domain-containing protein [Winogradskyella alexanderae]MCA0133538.1 TetR/AcrR family transcriptional regulator [Winogradskyella alexanderae]
MAKKTKITDSDIIDFYMDYVVKHHCKPESIEDFAKNYKFDDVVFYEYFTSFSDLEKTIYNLLFENSLALQKQNPEYISYSKKEKLLSLYFTFFENLGLNEDFVKHNLKGLENQLKALSTFSLLKTSFTTFIDELNLETISLNVDLIENIQQKAIKESAWIQFLFILKFWLDDTSESHEKTDILIEKSINTGIELIDTKSFYNIIDLAKFLYKEKVQ